MSEFNDKIVLITGAGSGMGKAMAKGFAERGALVVVADLNPEGGQAAVEEITSAGGRAEFRELNVADPDMCHQVVDAVVADHGRLDVLINNAGIGLIKEVEKTTTDEWDRIFAVNVKGLFFMAQAACKHMREQRSGKIINLASQAGRRGEALVAAYCASKAAVISINQSVALAMAPYGVNVNAMAPGVVDTPYWKQVDHEFGQITGKADGETFRDVARNIPLGRTSVPEDVVPLALFLASEGAGYITAQCYGVDGGAWYA